MQLVAADILAEARGLSWPLGASGVAIGLLLWIFGWHWHRFWIVFLVTVGAGVGGLAAQQAIGPRLLAAGLLFAVAAGLLAIDLSRLVAFAAGGLSVWFSVHIIVPTFQEPLICFLTGGILGVFTYRLQWMLLSSLVGALLIGHSALLLIEKLSKQQFAAADWAKNNALGLNIGVIVAGLLGLAVQGQLERLRESKEYRRREKAMAALSEEEREHIKQMPRRNWLTMFFGGDDRDYRRGYGRERGRHFEQRRSA